MYGANLFFVFLRACVAYVYKAAAFEGDNKQQTKQNNFFNKQFQKTN